MTSESDLLAPGRVYLVGAGPGDPGLITLRGVECLAQADVVLYDYLVNSQILGHAPGRAERICLGRHGQGRVWPQETINERLVAEAVSGKTVVRLKGGDPAVFARVAEEVSALLAAGIEFEIVPGITAALAAASYAGIPLTHRDAASAVALVTGHESEKDEPALDYQALAAFPGTLVFYMGVTSAAHWSAALLAAGKPADTPAAVVRRCSWPDQTSWRCTLETVAAVMAEQKIRPPALVIVGEAAALESGSEWFERRPLFGLKVMVTRPQGQIDPLRRRLLELGADVISQPAIEISPPADWRPVDAALERLAEFDWLVFSSANGVELFLGRLCEEHGDLRRLGGLQIAAIGPGTAEALAKYHLRADLIPEEFRAEALADALAEQAAGSRILLVRANRGRETLHERLTARGAQVEQVVAYQSRDVASPDADVANLLREDRIDWILMTSSAIARSLASLFGGDLRRARIATISPLTSAALRACGYEPAAEAATYTMEGIIAAVLHARERM